jgi:hypothetical protein
LFDKNSLVDTVNNGHNLVFEVGDFRVPPKLDPLFQATQYQSLQDGIDPDTSVKDIRIPLTRGQFGQHVIAYALGQPITVKAMVKYNANKLGGNHYDPRSSPDFAALEALKNLNVGGLPASSRSLKQ